MKKSKLLIALAVIALPFVMTSCSDDGYSLDKYWVSVATIKTDGLSGNNYFVQLDNGKKLWVASQNFHYRPKNNQRAMVNYTILSDEEGEYDHFVRMNDVSEVLTKGVIDLKASNADSIGNDKVQVEDIWVGSDYLNIIFGYNASYTGRPHFINLVNNTTVTPPSADTTYVEFRHNARDDQEIYGARGIVSFYLPSANLTETDECIIKIKVNSYREGTLNYVVKYARSQAQGLNMETPELPKLRTLVVEEGCIE